MESREATFNAFVVQRGQIILTLVDIQHKAIEVDSLFTGVFHAGVENVHEPGLSCS